MNSDFQKLCEQYVANKNVLTKSFKWSSDLMNISSALVLTNKKIDADEAALRDSESIIKASKGALSVFRDHVKVPVICKMVVNDNPEEYFKKVDDVYSILNKKKVFANEHQIMAAMTICDNVQPEDYEKYIGRTNEIYSRMKDEHKILTSDADIPFAAVLATSDLDVDHIINDMEACFKILKGEFSSKDSVQAICEVLALSDEAPKTKCAKVIELFNALKKAGRKYGTGYELATLGTLVMSKASTDEIVELIAQADDYLKKQRGFGNFTLGRRARRMYASQLALNFLSPDKGNDVALSSSLALTISLEICMILCITAAVSSSSH